MTEARRERGVASEGTAPGAIWFVLFLGAVLRHAEPGHPVGDDGRARSVIFAANLVVIAIDRPFSGAVVVSQQPIRAVLDDLENLP